MSAQGNTGHSPQKEIPFSRQHATGRQASPSGHSVFLQPGHFPSEKSEHEAQSTPQYAVSSPFIPSHPFPGVPP